MPEMRPHVEVFKSTVPTKLFLRTSTYDADGVSVVDAPLSREQVSSLVEFFQHWLDDPDSIGPC